MSALYTLMRGWARAALWLYADEVTIGGQEAADGPAILACNHPNSFLDAIMMAVFHPHPLHFLARGDAFRNPWVARVLRSLNAIPIYRLSEGREHLHRNDQTFAECIAILRGGGTILIFSEGLSEHINTIKPLRKGTARLAWLAWNEHDLRHIVVQPGRLWYHSFNSAPKRASIHFGKPLSANDIYDNGSPSHFYSVFNELLRERLSACPVGDVASMDSRGTWQSVLLAPFAAAGFITQGWYYVLLKRFAARKTQGTVFYDSVFFGLLLLTYPLFLICNITAVAALAGWQAALAITVMLPLTGWALKRWCGSYQTARRRQPQPLP